ncbi:hypothetical protein [Brachybacterium hainanense]|uniref:RDD domain-containing protein n=1 Tax=Brachybacterium hainanense TaxID=1541174 RepID=A0ABV6R7D4_9MICO
MSGGPSPTLLRRDPLATARGRAYARDCLGYLGIAAAMVPAGILLSRTVRDPRALRRIVTVASAVPPVLATIAAARAEAGPQRATWGKRREGLQVVRWHDGEGGTAGAATADPLDPSAGPAMGVPRALLRNTVKIALPWQLGHTLALGAAWGGFDERDPATLASAVVTYPLIGAMIGAVALAPGRGLHDRVAGTRVLGR